MTGSGEAIQRVNVASGLLCCEFTSRQGPDSAISRARNRPLFFHFAWRFEEPRRCGRI